nr:hypothetical protein [uncultured Rhodoferax sp.]
MDTKEQQQPLSAADAEKYLQSSLGEPDGYWRVFLQNNRRPDRHPAYSIPVEVVRGRPHYLIADLDGFITHYRATELARGKTPGSLGEAMRALGGWPTGRPLNATVTPQVEDTSGITFIQMMVADPLLVFRLAPEQARALAADLTEAADALDRAAARGSAS